MALRLASESTFRRIVDTLLSAATADHTFISFGDGESSTLRFANNQVVQNVSVREPSVSVRVAFGKKVGSASTNRLDGASLTTLVRQAETIARLAPEDPE
ncbi:MAG: DNA gyrase modulator, partial [Planctomycetota bacterium]